MQVETNKKRVTELLADGSWHSADSILTGLKLPVGAKRKVSNLIREITGPVPKSLAEVVDAGFEPLNSVVLPQLQTWLQRKRLRAYIVSIVPEDILILTSFRGQVRLKQLDSSTPLHISSALNELEGTGVLIPNGLTQELLRDYQPQNDYEVLDLAHRPLPFSAPKAAIATPRASMGHLEELERESLYIIREAIASAERPAMLFSLGKDSMVMLRLAEKAFAPEPLPFPLVNIDTRWKFQEMNRFRDWLKTRGDLNFIHYVNPDAITKDVNPFDNGSAEHTEITKTQALKRVLDEHRFDFVFGGARRDEEKSRAKERIFSVREAQYSWNPKNQRPELWDTYNTLLTGEQSMRVFPLSNWTELDIWRYLEIENVPLVPLYFSKRRPFVVRNGALIMVDDDRFRLGEGEEIYFEEIRFRSLGCYPLSGGVKSRATSLTDIVKELERTRVSERSSRVIDFDRGASMEQKKKDGYF